MLVKCEQCGNEFNKSQAEINRTTHNFCSRECSRLHNREKVICECCGKEFLKSKSKLERTSRNFCSNECKFKDQNKRVEIECFQCGKKHFKRQDELKKNERNFCSKECLYKFQNKQIEKVCPNCNNPFLISPSGLDKRTYCCDKCKFEHMKIRDTKNRKRIQCDNCGTEFVRYNNRLHKNKYNFCSYDCMGEFRRNDDFEPNYYDCKEWKQIRNLALMRDGNKCAKCGTKEGKLIVHHIVSRKKGGKDVLENTITLCNTCHIKVHLEDLQNGAENIKIQKYYKKILKNTKTP